MKQTREYAQPRVVAIGGGTGLSTMLRGLKRFTSRCQAFDMAAFKSNIAYFYTPGGRIFFLVYLIAGLVVPIAMQKAVDLLKRAFLSLRRTQRA